jgi:ferredoxin-NADP reductase
MAESTAWRPARLRAARSLTPDVRLLEIEPGGDFIPPRPGSHINVAVRIGERPDMRSYTVVGACADGLYRIAVKRLATSRGGGTYLWGLEVGARLSIAGPHNHFDLSRGRSDYLLVAGGIGITPIYSMALALQDAEAQFRVLYACRRQEDGAFADELRARIGDRLELFISELGQRIDFRSAIDRLAPDGELYVCGPIPMLEEAKQRWRGSGRAVEGLRFETFGNGGRHPALPFRVVISRIGRTIEVPANQTMLEALEAAGVDMMHDCRRGECGLCALDILDADARVDHRDVFFSEAEKARNAKLCTCVSRAVGGTVTVDIPARFE